MIHRSDDIFPSGAKKRLESSCELIFSLILETRTRKSVELEDEICVHPRTFQILQECGMKPIVPDVLISVNLV